jgi:small GTP-binding protein
LHRNKKYFHPQSEYGNITIENLQMKFRKYGKIVAIVGRPNVGKSTLFNRLTQTRRAIVNETAGTTRDRQYGKSEWSGHEFSVIDTGGWVNNSSDTFEQEIKRQVQLAINEADVILFLVDVQCGITDLDFEVAQLLKKTNNRLYWLPINQILSNGSIRPSNFTNWAWVILFWFLPLTGLVRATCSTNW